MVFQTALRLGSSSEMDLAKSYNANDLLTIFPVVHE